MSCVADFGDWMDEEMGDDRHVGEVCNTMRRVWQGLYGRVCRIIQLGMGASAELTGRYAYRAGRSLMVFGIWCGLTVLMDGEKQKLIERLRQSKLSECVELI